MSALRDAVDKWDCVEVNVTVQVAGFKALAGVDPDRWMIAFATKIGNVTITTSTSQSAPGTQGVTLTAFAAPMVFTYKDWPGFVQGNWYAFGGGGAGNVTVWTAALRR